MIIPKSNEQPVLSTTGHLMSVEVMKGVIWAGFALCFLAFCSRAYIRYVCFRRLFVEDYLMLFTLGILLGSAIVSQLRLQYVYIMEDVGNGLIPIPATFMLDVPKALVAVFSETVICSIGIYAVKVNFLLFFRRLHGQLTQYLVFWWIVLAITIGCFAVSVAFLEYKCTLSGLDVIFVECTSKADIAREWRNVIMSCSLDAFTDILILCFPISILWGVRVPMRKKIVLGCVFSLTIFTVIVTIIRGTIQYGRIASDFSQSQNIGWVWFWIVIELTTSYLIACLVSFRLLFVRNEKKASGQDQGLRRSPRSNSAKKRVVDSLLDTVRGWEGTSPSHGDFLDCTLPSGRMSVDFTHDGGWAVSEISYPESTKQRTHGTHHHE
ncbi:hypothetical protein B0H66DRAFT_609958 [Apodospora peruviana]|uniref:Rhodopsin domain-containing protein n=1 Tax=Apodospora peruviana TaxID=516989 RepID=A0AAE0ME54_9PEZI|nr:hypothetical protein B0H66DRAFT_609958 [Apodospora peruviana]